MELITRSGACFIRCVDITARTQSDKDLTPCPSWIPSVFCQLGALFPQHCAVCEPVDFCTGRVANRVVEDR